MSVGAQYEGNTPKHLMGGARGVSEVFRAWVSNGCRTPFFIPQSIPNYSGSFRVFCALTNAAASAR